MDKSLWFNMPKVNSCCYGVPLRKGTLIITILELVIICFGLLAVLIGMIALHVFGSILENSKNDPAAHNPELVQAMTKMMKVLNGLCIYLAVVSVPAVIITSMAIHGARTENGCLLVPWIIMRTIEIIGAFIMGIILIIKANDISDAFSISVSLPDREDIFEFNIAPAYVIQYGAGMLIYLGVDIYFAIVVHSFRQELRNRGHVESYAKPGTV